MRIKYLRKAELKRFFAQITDKRDRALFAAIYHYGLRVSEATLLKLEDIDFERSSIYIHRLKGGVCGEKPLFSNTAKLLKEYLKERQPTGEALFTGRQGDLKRRQIQNLFKAYMKKAGLDARYTVHCLRHSIATHLIDAGQDIHFVQDHLGHTNIQNTLVYAHLTDKRRKAVFKKLEASTAVVKV